MYIYLKCYLLNYKLFALCIYGYTVSFVQKT